MTKPILSVLIDTYNHERYIEQAVVTAIEQDFPASYYEILVVDDGSTDRTSEIVRKFAPRVRLLTKKNGGQASAFNAGLAETKGELIAFLDGDDWWAKGKLSAVVGSFERNPQDAAASHAYFEVCEDRGPIVCGPSEEEVLTLDTPEAAALAREHWRFLLPCALTVRRRVLERVVPIPEALVFSADGPIATASMAMGVRVLPLPLAYYRIHSGNLNAIDDGDAVKMRSKYQMGAAMYEIVERLLGDLNVSPESLAAFLDPPWVHVNRTLLARFGGTRLRAFQTEMRYFRYGYNARSRAHRLLKYAIVGVATLLLPPQAFYKARNWYQTRGASLWRGRLARGRQA